MKRFHVIASMLLSLGIVFSSMTMPKKVSACEFPEDSSDAMIEITEDTFPDSAFRDIILKTFDDNGDKFLSTAEINGTKKMFVGNSKIKDLTGIQYFTALTVFECSDNAIGSLDVSKNTALTKLYCSNCGLSSLDVSTLTNLEILECRNNKLTTLDVSLNKSLTGLDCAINELSSLSVSSNKKLTYLFCAYNSKIGSLNVMNNPDLTDLDCSSCGLGSLNVSSNAALVNLFCSRNSIAVLNLSDNPELKALACDGNHLSKLDVSANNKLTRLSCGSNSISALEVSALTDLTRLECEENKLTELNVLSNSKLEILLTHGNTLTELAIYNSSALLELLAAYPLELTSSQYYRVWDFDSESKTFTKELTYDKDTALVTKTPPTPEPGPNPDDPTPEPQPETPTPEPVKDTSFEDFVERLYTVALGRASEAEGKAYWVEQVVKNGFTGADCARFFLLDAPEFMNRNLPDDQFVEVLYQTFFGRESEADGKAYWLGRLASGSTKAELVNDFIESVEWCNICATYGVKSGALYHKATVPSKNAVKFATRLYTCCLGRDPEEDGLNYWALALTSLDATGYQAASLFFTLPEFVGLKTTNEEYLTRLYTTFMGREPEADGFNYWLGLLNGGTDRNDVMKAFAGCPEFQEICNQYGIVRGEI